MGQAKADRRTGKAPTPSMVGAARRRLGLADLIVRTVSLRNIRSYARLDVDLQPGLVLVVGPNSAGKTNLLESLHVGTQGFSPRTRADAQLVRFGERAGRISLRGLRGESLVELEVTLELGEGKKAKLNGAALRAAEQLRSEVATLVFTPDRLAVVKGGPAVRRAYFDRVIGRLAPARAHVAVEYAAAIAQRNAALRRAAGGYSSREAIAPWTEQVAILGRQLVEARTEVVASLASGFAVRAEERVPHRLLQFDEKLRQIESPKGSMIGRLAIDLRTGNIYGFPTDALGYPRNPGKSETPVSDPILLGRFNLDKLD